MPKTDKNCLWSTSLFWLLNLRKTYFTMTSKCFQKMLRDRRQVLLLIWVSGCVGFPLITQNRQKLQLWLFAAFRNSSIKDICTKFGILTSPNLYLLSKTQTRVFLISRFLVTRSSNDIDMKRGPVTKLDKRNTVIS